MLSVSPVVTQRSCPECARRCRPSDTSDGYPGPAAAGFVDAVRDVVDRYGRSLGGGPSTGSRPVPTVEDDRGREVQFLPYQERDFDALVRLYRVFDPNQRSQGVPPVGEQDIREWLGQVLDGPSVLAWDGGQVVGHVLFLPDDEGEHELAIFVHQEYQRAGIGSALLETGLEYARGQGVTTVWVSVARGNRAAQRLCRGAGFRFDEPSGLTFRMSRRL
jgi:ribosomal protein S18 acetylase RimI-like enzyme